MSEWWSYSLHDLLLFSPQTYYRLFELYNLDWWPLQLVALALGLVVLALYRRGGGAGRVVAVMLAAAWLWVAWAFHGQRYASINPAAEYFAWAFALQALLVAWVGAVRGAGLRSPAARMRQRLGLGLYAFAVLVYPLIGPLLGRGWTQAEVFGMAPDPTALATLGLLLSMGWRQVWMLYPIPVLWCLVSGATLWTMDAPDFAVAPVAAVLVAVFAGVEGFKRWWTRPPAR